MFSLLAIKVSGYSIQQLELRKVQIDEEIQLLQEELAKASDIKDISQTLATLQAQYNQTLKESESQKHSVEEKIGACKEQIKELEEQVNEAKEKKDLSKEQLELALKDLREKEKSLQKQNKILAKRRGQILRRYIFIASVLLIVGAAVSVILGMSVSGAWILAPLLITLVSETVVNYFHQKELGHSALEHKEKAVPDVQAHEQAKSRVQEKKEALTLESETLMKAESELNASSNNQKTHERDVIALDEKLQQLTSEFINNKESIEKQITEREADGASQSETIEAQIKELEESKEILSASAKELQIEKLPKPKSTRKVLDHRR
jgi:phage shock protein A